MDRDLFFMQQAFKEALKAADLGEVPVGAVITSENQIISQAHNLVETEQRATAHAEILAIESASKKLNRWRLSGCTLYTTLEPCALCAGSVLLSRLDRVVFAAKDLRQGALGSWVNLLDGSHPIHPKIEVLGGVMEEESAALLRAFFKEKREKK